MTSSQQRGAGGARQAGEWTVSMVAFGEPSSPRTSSGYASNLTRVLRAAGHVRQEFSAKLVSPLDALRGAFGLNLQNGRPRANIRRGWMWSERGSDLLTRRLDARIRAAGDHGAFLQIGTLIRIDPTLGPHLMRTDMTIAQARRAGHFAVAELSRQRLDTAEDLQRSILLGAAHVFAASKWTAESLEHDCGVPREKITVLYTGGNLVIPRELRQERVPREILFVGMDWERKGGPLLLDAFHLLHKRLPDATLRIVGCSPPVNHPGVRVEGVLDKRIPEQADLLARCYLRASCFCLPTHFDPFPNAIVEAASVGLPSVAIDNGSRREAVQHHVTGALAPTPTPEALADTIYDVIHNPTYCQDLGKAAEAYAREHFNWLKVVERIGMVVRSRVHADDASLLGFPQSGVTN